ncbi:hypothetical protein O181_084762 [Austropuccinia psidii MF-1]|uniref:Uncharacterized protein n=1 Tax=Austropuccinia psidii MF-1 TaxID=1389203 RepID=A0A9Q3FUU8_9BASI|nr:hypothetical protein [Austropuccinia psidii MF-1]
MSEGARARLGEVEDEEGEESVEEEDSGETEVADALTNAQLVLQGSNLAPTNQPLVSQSDPSLLKIMEQIANIMGELSQAAAPRDNSKAPAFKTPSMKAPNSFDGTQAHKLRGFIQSCQFVFHNDPEDFFSDRKKFLYSTSLDFLQELIDITLELEARYHERQKVKGSHQEKKPPVTGSNSSRPPQESSSKRPHHKKNKKGKKFQASKDKSHSASLNKDNKLISSEKERRIKEGLCTYWGGKHPIEKNFKRPQNKPGRSRGFPSKQGKA